MSYRRLGTCARPDREEDRLLEQLAFQHFCARHPWLTREQAAAAYKAQEEGRIMAGQGQGRALAGQGQARR